MQVASWRGVFAAILNRSRALGCCLFVAVRLRSMAPIRKLRNVRRNVNGAPCTMLPASQRSGCHISSHLPTQPIRGTRACLTLTRQRCWFQLHQPLTSKMQTSALSICWRSTDAMAKHFSGARTSHTSLEPTAGCPWQWHSERPLARECARPTSGVGRLSRTTAPARTPR